MSRDLDADNRIVGGRLHGSYTSPPSVNGGEREIIWHKPTDPTPTGRPTHHDDAMEEEHPAWGMASVHRSSTGGSVLFDSEIKHAEIMRLTIRRATRTRGLNRDWIHEKQPDLIEVDMSLAQWGALVSSVNTTGVPVTIRATETQGNVPGLRYEPRLAESTAEVHGAAERAFEKVKAAMAAVDALDGKATAKERREAMGALRAAINNSVSNVNFAAKSLTEHVETVVSKAQADMEAMVVRHAERIGLPASQVPALSLTADPPLEIEGTVEP